MIRIEGKYIGTTKRFVRGEQYLLYPVRTAWNEIRLPGRLTYKSDGEFLSEWKIKPHQGCPEAKVFIKDLNRKVKSGLIPGKTCVIVGNGPSALRKENGALIDSYSTVVRINDFATLGYEKCVGSKTDILFTCRLNEYNSPEKISVFPQVITSLLMNPLEGVRISDEILASPNITEHLNMKYAMEVSKVAGIKWPRYPSTGLICIHRMIELGYFVLITGFDHFGKGNKHYYTEGDRLKAYRHSSTGEKRYVNQLINSGKLKRL